MAKFQSANVDEMANELRRLGHITGAMAQEMVAEGAEVIADAWRDVIREHDHVESGDMLESVNPTPVQRVAGGVAAEIYPQGMDGNGVRNVEKAFLLHYGWKAGEPRRGKKGEDAKGRKGAYKGDHFVDEVEQRAVDGVDEAMEAVMDRHMREGQ